MPSNTYTIILILIMGLVTLSLRALPYVIFSRQKQIPKMVLYLGDVLPAAAIGMLVVYCLKDVNFLVAPFGLAEVIAVSVIVLVQVLKRNSILSIILGTATYMILLNLI